MARPLGFARLVPNFSGTARFPGEFCGSPHSKFTARALKMMATVQNSNSSNKFISDAEAGLEPSTAGSARSALPAGAD